MYDDGGPEFLALLLLPLSPGITSVCHHAQVYVVLEIKTRALNMISQHSIN